MGLILGSEQLAALVNQPLNTLSTRRTPIKVAMLSLPPRTQSLLEYFFANAGRASFSVAVEEQAETAIFDLDTAGSREHWGLFYGRTGKPGIALAVKPQDVPGALWVQKPVTPAALLAAAATLQAGHLGVSKAPAPVPAALDEGMAPPSVDTSPAPAALPPSAVQSPAPLEAASLAPARAEPAPPVAENLSDASSGPLTPATSNEPPAEPPGSADSVATDATAAEGLVDSTAPANADPLGSMLASAAAQMPVADIDPARLAAALTPAPVAPTHADEPQPADVEVPPAVVEPTTTSPASSSPTVTPAAAPLPSATGGFRGMLRRLFGGSTGATPARHAAAEPRPAGAAATSDTAAKSADRAAKRSDEAKDEAGRGEHPPAGWPDADSTWTTPSQLPEEVSTLEADAPSQPTTQAVSLAALADTPRADAAATAPSASQPEDVVEAQARPADESHMSDTLAANAGAHDPDPTAPAVEQQEVEAPASAIKLTFLDVEPAPAVQATTTPVTAPAAPVTPTPSVDRSPTVDTTPAAGMFDPEACLIGPLREAFMVAAKWQVPTQFECALGPVVVDAERNEAHLGFGLEQMVALAAQPLGKRGKVHTLSAGEYTRFKQKAEGGSLTRVRLDDLLWRVGIACGQGRLPARAERGRTVFLSQWPNLTRLMALPQAPRVAALWALRGASVNETVALLSIKPRDVVDFYNGAWALNLVTEDGHHVKRALRKNARNRGLLTRLIGWLRR